MKRILLFVLVQLCTLMVIGQVTPDTIEIRKKALGSVYLKNGNYLNVKQLTSLTKPIKPAHQQIQKAKFTLFFASLFSYVGGGLIGYPIGTAIGGGEPYWGMAAAGVGIGGLGILLGTVTDKQIKKSVTLYNENQFQEYNKTHPESVSSPGTSTPPSSDSGQETIIPQSDINKNQLPEHNPENLPSPPEKKLSGTFERLFNQGKGVSQPADRFDESKAALVLGLNVGGFKTKINDGRDNGSTVADHKLGFQFGTLYNLHDFGPVGLRSGFVLSFEKMDYNSAPGIWLAYARIPVYAQHFVTDKFSVNGGLNFDFWIFEMNDWEFEFEDESMNRWFNPALSLGAEYKLLKNASIYLSYNPYLGNMLSSDFRGTENYRIRMKRNLFQLGINFDL